MTRRADGVDWIDWIENVYKPLVRQAMEEIEDAWNRHEPKECDLRRHPMKIDDDRFQFMVLGGLGTISKCLGTLATEIGKSSQTVRAAEVLKGVQAELTEASDSLFRMAAEMFISTKDAD